MTPPFRLEPLDDTYDRDSFTCGVEALDRYLKTQVTQDIRRRMATCFVAIKDRSQALAAYYTIASAGISMHDLPPELTKKLPRYPTVPAIRIGRLAVDLEFRNRGLGGALLADALRRVLLSPPAAFALLVDAKEDKAVAFYRHHGFQPLASQPRTLFLAIASAKEILL